MSTPLKNIAAFGPAGTIHVIVEASRGMTAKCKFDPRLETFVFGRPLPHGLAYPFDWGFIPGTHGEDGDPLDALVLHDAACPVGCVIRCQPVGLLRVTQRQKGKILRNDRFLLRPAADPMAEREFILQARLKRELEQFFLAAVTGTGKKLTFEGWGGPGAALKAVTARTSSGGGTG